MNLNDDICRNRHKGEPESVAAHEATKSNKLRDRAKIIQWLVRHQPCSAEEVERGLGMGRSTVSARMSELKRDGIIVKVGRTVTASGTTAGTYKIVAESE